MSKTVICNLILQAFGIILLSVIVHELIHFLMLKEVSQACLVFGSNKTFAYIQGSGPLTNYQYEFWAFLGQGIIALILIVGLAFCLKKKLDNCL